MTFGKLVDSIHMVHGEMAAQASKAVNISLTLRNWLIGYYVVLSQKLKERGLERVSERELRRYRTFARVYPQIWESATPKLAVPGKNWSKASPSLIDRAVSN